VRTATESIADRTLEGGEQALQELPNVGEGIARIIDGYVGSGRSEMLERLKGEVAPGKLLTEVPGIGEELAQGIAEDGFGGLFG
jgi:DNA polymerase/3'-5' exonuclease PolX